MNYQDFVQVTQDHFFETMKKINCSKRKIMGVLRHII